ncbi:MAG: nitrilase [Deltaproteobacteria bacterium HGW-Deltaproteobacteria-21]|nr:MAG: nitrilase [Deltaproteobacteria bacterium HGW-Deltaproteobacteria-21]
MRDVRVAAVCMASIPGDVEGNFKRTERFVSGAAGRGAEIVCFPELSIHGYTLRNQEHRLGDHQEIVRRIEDLARSQRILILAGLLIADEYRRPCICQVAAGPEGLIGLYRKTHLSPPEKEVFLPGEELKTYSHKGIAFGIELCYEAHFPEISAILALQGAEILFLPHASPRGTPEEKLSSWLRHLPSRAFDNSVFVVACNQTGDAEDGPSFPGVALVLDPSGRLIASRAEGGEGMLIADLREQTLAQTRSHRMKYFLPSRRPELYGGLVEKKRGTKRGSSLLVPDVS